MDLGLVRGSERSTLSSKRVVLFQVPNHIGLGHMNRAASIALAMREVSPTTLVMFAVEGETHGILESYGLPYVSIPHPESLRKLLGNGGWSLEQERSIGTDIARSLMRTIRPDLLIFDCFPSHSFLEVAFEQEIPTILCLRNMKQPEDYARRPGVAQLLKSCLSVVIPHEKSDSCVPSVCSDKAVYVGDIVRELPENPYPVQLRFNTPSDPVVLVTAGGGGHETALDFLSCCIRAIEHLRNRLPNVMVIVVPGPLFKRWSELSIIPNMRVIPFDPDLAEMCATADVVLAQAGYNSLNELVCLGVPTITVPAARGFDDQFKRAETLAATYSNIHIGSGKSHEEMSEKIESLLHNQQPRTRRDPPNGAFRAACHIEEMISALPAQ
jgi:predicted glycosyltransferase